MKIEFGVGLGRNERMSEVGELSRVAEESGFSHATFVWRLRRCTPVVSG